MAHREVAIALALAILTTMGTPSANDGRLYYDEFRCVGCHGSDARGQGAGVKTKSIAGRESQSVYSAVFKMIAHHQADHMPGSCDIAPTIEQIRAIADYVAALPR